MGLSERLAEVNVPNLSNSGCRTCKWLLTLSDKDRAAFYDWVQNDHSIMQLHRLCVSDPDNPLTVSFTALRNHVRDCK